MHGVNFPPGLLGRLLRALRPGTNRFATFGAANFRGATFSDGSFYRARFPKGANFDETTFNDGIHFYRTSARWTVSFHLAQFTGRKRFSKAAFESVDFSFARFASGATFLIKAKELRLYHATLTGNVAAEATIGALSAEGARGSGRLDLRLRAARVDLSALVFDGTVTVHALQQPLDWSESGMADPAAGVPPVRMASLADTDIDRLVLTDVDMSECRFAGMQRLDKLFLDGRCVFGRDPRGVRQVLVEEGYWRAAAHPGRSRIRGVRGWIAASRDIEIVGPARLEVMYRQLRKAFEDARNEPGAADFYYGEMEMRRAAAQRVPERVLLWLYWFCSGYALRASRALTCLMTTMAATIVALTVWGFPGVGTNLNGHGTLATSTGQQPITFSLEQSSAVTALPDRAERATEITLNAVIFRGSDTQLSTIGWYLDVIARILGPLFLGLSAVAVRNRIKR